MPERTILTAKTRNRYFDSSDDVIIALPCSKRIAGSVLYFLRFMFSPPSGESITHASSQCKVKLIMSFTITMAVLILISRALRSNKKVVVRCCPSINLYLFSLSSQLIIIVPKK